MLTFNIYTIIILQSAFVLNTFAAVMELVACLDVLRASPTISSRTTDTYIKNNNEYDNTPFARMTKLLKYPVATSLATRDLLFHYMPELGMHYQKRLNFTNHVQTHSYPTRNAQDYSINKTKKMFSDCAIRNFELFLEFFRQNCKTFMIAKSLNTSKIN